MNRHTLLLLALGSVLVLRPPLKSQEVDAPWTFAVLGHARGDGHARHVVNPVVFEFVERCREYAPEFVVLTGDNIWGDYNTAVTDMNKVREEWDALDRALEPLGVPIYRVPGNHDIKDVPTRDLYIERYGRPPAAIRHKNALLLLLSSAWFPPDGDQSVRRGVRGVPISPDQLRFVDEALKPQDFDHAMLFMHHLLWWQPAHKHWKELHPLLVGRKVRAVFGGDYGPTKFSHMRADEIDYIHAAVETDPGVAMLRINESARLLSGELDLWLRVRVSKSRVEIIPETVGGLTTGMRSPARYRDVNDLDNITWARLHSIEGTWREKRLTAFLLLVGAACGGLFTLGAGLLWMSWRRRRRRNQSLASASDSTKGGGDAARL